mgnify:CR=1 FL=1
MSENIPPYDNGYNGIDLFIAAIPNPYEIMSELVTQIRKMKNIKIVVQEPFRVMWSVNLDNAVETFFNAWILTYDVNEFMVCFDFVGGISSHYVTMMRPMFIALHNNGTLHVVVTENPSKVIPRRLLLTNTIVPSCSDNHDNNDNKLRTGIDLRSVLSDRKSVV